MEDVQRGVLYSRGVAMYGSTGHGGARDAGDHGREKG